MNTTWPFVGQAREEMSDPLHMSNSANSLVMTRDELVIEFALTRLDHPTLELEEVAALLVRRVGPRQALHLAAQNLATRDELRGDVFAAAVEHVLRTLLQLRDGSDDRILAPCRSAPWVSRRSSSSSIPSPVAPRADRVDRAARGRRTSTAT